MSFRDFPLVRVLPSGMTVACICGDLLYRGETDPNCPAHDDELGSCGSCHRHQPSGSRVASEGRVNEVDYGWWSGSDGMPRYRVSWDADTKALYIFDARTNSRELLDHINTRERVDELLKGWSDVCMEPNSIEWVRFAAKGVIA